MLFEANGEPLLTCGLLTHLAPCGAIADEGVRVPTPDPRLESRGNSGQCGRERTVGEANAEPLLTCDVIKTVSGGVE